VLISQQGQVLRQAKWHAVGVADDDDDDDDDEEEDDDD